MAKSPASPNLKARVIDDLLDCQSAAHSINWLFERYDAGEHEASLEAARLLVSLLRDKLSDMLDLLQPADMEMRHA